MAKPTFVSTSAYEQPPSNSKVPPQLNGVASKVMMRTLLLDFGAASLEAVQNESVSSDDSKLAHRGYLGYLTG